MEGFLIVFSWLFTIISVFSNLTTSVYGNMDIFSNPSSCSQQTSSFWTSKIQNTLLSFGHLNVIMTALTVLLVIVNYGVYQLRRSHESTTFLPEGNVRSALEEPSCHMFSLTEILLATQDFNDALVIGKGGFGKVYKGFIHGYPLTLAIKRLKPDSKQGSHEFWREIETLSKLRHIHLVSLLGYCMESEEMILVYEYMPKGTVADNLYKSSRNGQKESIHLTWEQRLRICIGTARGLDYLHTGTQHGVIHRDVKDTNILLDDNFVAKISDFGLSKLGSIGEIHGEYSTKVKGTIGYLDPYYMMTKKASTKSDVYAFGIVLLVVLSGRPAVEMRAFGEMQSLLTCFRECVTKGETNELIDPCLQGEILMESLSIFMEVAENCLHRNPRKRITMAQVIFHLEHALEKHLGNDTVVDHNSPVGSNRSFEFYELQFAPITMEGIISLPGEGKDIQNADLQARVEVLQSKGKYGKKIKKPLWGRPWGALWNIRKHSEKKDLACQTIIGHPSEWKYPVRMFSLKDIQLATQNFSKDFIIGKGCYTVYKGVLSGDSGGIVAIKRYSSDSREEFQAEFEVLSSFQYIHLISCVGFCNEGDERILVYEYMSHGSFDRYLYLVRREDDIFLTWQLRLRICIGAARGLNHLHHKGVIHRDFKDRNIMLNENFEAKISNFGMSLNLGESESLILTRIAGTYGYMDPTYYTRGRVSKGSDVYSFGIVLLVVLSGKPASDPSRRRQHHLVKACSQDGRHYGELIDQCFVEGIPSASLTKFVELIKSCLHEDQKLRPDMAQVVVDLEEALELALDLTQMVMPVFKQEPYSEVESWVNDTHNYDLVLSSQNSPEVLSGPR